MCTIICTVRTVFWYIMSLVGTLLILVSLLTNKWVEGQIGPNSLNSAGKMIPHRASNHVYNCCFVFTESVMDTAVGIFKEATSGDIQGVDDLGKLAEKNVGLFKDCMVGRAFYIS